MDNCPDCVPEPPPSAKFVWTDPLVVTRNAFVLFRREFHLPGPPGPDAVLCLFADSRYRLRVNGVFAASGPARFVTSEPEFDSVNLGPLLRPGRNVLEAEVNFYGAPSFQTMPDGQPGFIAWGRAGEADLATPGEWLAAPLDAWRPDAPAFSFAQGPVEICDTRRAETPAGSFARPAALDGPRAPWGRLRPYSGRPFQRGLITPSRIEAAGALRDPKILLAVMARREPQEPRQNTRPPAPVWAVASWILSPRSQVVRMSCLWPRLELNGKPVSAVDDSKDSPLGNHQTAELRLNDGWNLLTARFEVLTEFWAFLLGFAEEAGLSFHGLPRADCDMPLAVVAGGSDPDGPPLPRPGDTTLPAGWELCDGAPPNLTPARVCAWDEPAPGAFRNLPASRLAEMSPIHARAAFWCLRFEGEFLGHPVLEVEAPEGAVLDVICDDWLTRAGTAALYKSNPFTDSADRFILRGGRQTVELFHVRGGKFLQVTLRAPAGPSPLSLHRVAVRSRQTTGEPGVTFSSGQSALDWAFAAAVRTLASSTSSSYADCPWRERGMYIGDALVSLHLDLITTGDPRTARRMLRVFAGAAREDGLLPACAPAWLRYSFGDYTLLWILALRDFWALTGETSLVRELWPAVGRIWRSPAWERGKDGLWTARPGELFVDWGVLPSERAGEANAVLNILRVAALRASGELAALAGDEEQQRSLLREAAQVEEQILNTLWIEPEGRLAPSRDARTPALHANILALYTGIGRRPLRASILRYIEPLLAGNFARGISGGQFSGHAELYFFHFLLPALAAHGRAGLAERLVADHYGYLRSLGDDTLPECFCRVHHSIGSRCHAWSGAAAIYAARYVLGLRPAKPGDPAALLFDPVVESISRAEGRIAHPAGWIEISWERRDGGSLLASWKLPPGVTLTDCRAQASDSRRMP